LYGAVAGGLIGLGLVLVLHHLPGIRRPDVFARIDPYLRNHRPVATRVPGSSTARPGAAIRALLGPLTLAIIGVLERLTGGPEQLGRRLRLAGRSSDVEAFRVEQVLWGSGGVVLGMVLAVFAVVTRGASPVWGLIMVALGGLIGVVARDQALQSTIRRRGDRMSREFPTVADLLALAVAAGEGPLAAMERVARSSQGALPEEFARTVTDVRSGTPLPDALLALGERTPVDALGRFGEGMAIAVERGTPLTEVLRAQAQDARENSKRELLESAGKREIFMLIPVVFLILPLVIVIALFPGIAVLELAL
jgi:tight adherence protein C